MNSDIRSKPAIQDAPGLKRSRGSRLLAIAALGSVLALTVCGRFVDWNTVFVNGLNVTLNDQVHYISVARNLVDTGRLNISLIYPPLLSQPHSNEYLYVPGQYYMLAASFALFGYSAAHAFWPSLAAFMLSSVLVVAIASALFGRERALSSWALFALFPLNLIYAFTAMAEMNVVASELAAFAIFLWLPRNLRVWLGPATLVLPLLFRETGLVIALIMAGVVYKDSGGRWKPVAQFSLLSVLVAALVLLSPIAGGRPSLLRANVFAESYASLYGGAFSTPPPAPPAAWAAAVVTKLESNLKILMSPPVPLEYLSLYFILSGIPLSLILWYRRRDAVYLSIFGALSIVLIAILGLYTVWMFRGIRTMLLLEPFVAMLWADCWQRLRGALRHRHLIGALAGVPLAVLAVASVHSAYADEDAINRKSTANTAFLESIRRDTGGVLASPWQISLDYVLKHHPSKWTFLPSDDRTLAFVNSKFKVSTVVLPDPPSTGLTPAGIVSIGLVEQERVVYDGGRYRIFEAPAPVR